MERRGYKRGEKEKKKKGKCVEKLREKEERKERGRREEEERIPCDWKLSIIKGETSDLELEYKLED